MAAAASRHVGRAIRAGLVVSATSGGPPPGFDSIVGGHPLPTAASEDAGRRALALADSVGIAETLLVLISGGASALMAAPAEGVTLDDKRATTERLLRGGADIHALNTVRKHLSSIKGGWLAARTKGACVALVISDVVGDDLSVIASGPTVADTSTFGDALDVLRRFGGETAFPSAVVARLRRGVGLGVPETPKPDHPRLAHATTRVIGSRRDAMAGAAVDAAARGYDVLRVDAPVVGEARTAAVAHLRAAMTQASGRSRPLCIVSSGETTVEVTGHGKGGRNQEFALASALAWGQVGDRSGSDGGPDPRQTPIVLASVGTDGIDGPTAAAGALVDPTTLQRAAAAGLSPNRFLSDNNAYAFFDALGDLIHTGPTGTNVGDLQVILLA
jgi:glycerate 2-kinase